MTGGSSGASSKASQAQQRKVPNGQRRKTCLQCGKKLSTKDEPNRPVSKDEHHIIVDDDGHFYCGKHRMDQFCRGCNQLALTEAEAALELERRAYRRDMGRVVKNMWKKMYLNEKGDKVPWSDDEDTDNDEDKDGEDMEDAEDDSPSPPGGSKKCAHCGRGGDLERCSRCKTTFYCSRSHQAADYAKHKASCRAPQAPVNDSANSTGATEDEKPSNYKEQLRSSKYAKCAYCGKRNKLSVCARCEATFYCSRDHQLADYADHKYECPQAEALTELHAERPDMKSIWRHKPPRGVQATEPAHMPVITWRELQEMHPNVATGRTLEVTIVSKPSSKFAPLRDGRDAEGVVRRVSFYTHRPPPGFGKGCVLRWRNPWCHFFLDDVSEANIEHWDLSNVSVRLDTNGKRKRRMVGDFNASSSSLQ